MSAYAYYPGCSLHGTAVEYGLSTQAVCQALGVELREVDDWNCCGASSAHVANRWLAHGLVARNMRLARATGLKELVIPCAACFARFQETQAALRDPETAAGIEEVAGGEVPRDLTIEPLLAILSEPALLARLQAAVTRPLAGLKVAPYYGCLLTRPPEVARFDDPEDPQTLDNLLRALGAEVVSWPGKTACCGSSLALSRTEVVLDLSHRLLAWAEEAGADAIATACPMCHSNLDLRQGQMRREGKGDHALPVYYFTELAGVALGIGSAELGISRHLVDAAALLERVPAGGEELAMARVGVFVCHCGSNIGGTVDCGAVAAAARQMPGVVHASDYKYMCSEPGQRLIQDRIAAEQLDRVVVASCSPRMHEPTFRRTVAAAGVNPYRMEMANLREHCSWVHGDKPVATAKAVEIVGMLVAKALRDEALRPGRAELSKRLLVIGGGIAGIQAALDVANAGYEVTLVERTPTIGGKMAMLDKTFPTLDCSACILTPLMVDVVQHPKIRLMTSAEVEEVHGFVGNFDVTLRQKARYVDHAVCNGCGTCWGKCPVKDVVSEFDQGMGRRTAIYLPFPQAIPNKPVIDAAHCRSIAYREAQARQAAEQGLGPEEAAKLKPVGPDGRKLPPCGICEKLCSTKAVRFDDHDTLVTERFGAIVVANGYDLFMLDGSHDEQLAPPERKPYYGEYGYGRYPDVITALQLERLMNASGPTKGEVVRPSDGKHPRAVVFVACVGSRDEKVGRPYCSKICCMYTAKQAIMLREHDPRVESYVFYMDLRAGGRSYDEFTRRAQEAYGAHYLRGRVSRVYRKGERYVVQGYDGLLGRPVEIEADLVVLANGVTSARGSVELMQKLSISYDGYGFINEAHVKLRPVETNTAGIYLAGCAAGPKDIPDTVSQASAAAAKVAGLFARPFIETEPTISEVLAQRCVACHLCEEVCPYGAVTFVEQKGGRLAAQINPAVCKGCGLCAAGCRGRAIVLHGFNDQQLLAEVESLFARPVPLRGAPRRREPVGAE